MQISLHIVILFSLLSFVSTRKIRVGDKCDADIDHTAIGRCARPWLDLWELIRVHESYASDLFFPLPFYARESVLFLCDLYVKSRDSCLTDDVIKTCSRNEMVMFIESHMQYFCGESAVLALNHFDCLNRAVTSRPHCRESIIGVPLPTHQTGKCKGIPRFHECVEPTVNEQCGETGVAVLVEAITAFGCELDPETVKKARTTVIDYLRSHNKSKDAIIDILNKERENLTLSLSALRSVEEFTKTSNNKTPTEINRTSTLTKVQSTTTNLTKSSSVPTTATTSTIATTLTAKKSTKWMKTTSTRKTTTTTTPSTTTTTTTTRNVLSSSTTTTDDEICDAKKRSEIAKCFAPLLRHLDEIHSRYPGLRTVLFPLFNYTTSDMLSLCDIFQLTLEDCMSPTLITTCHDDSTVVFVDQMLGMACSSQSNAQFATNFDCIGAVMTENQQCFRHIVGSNIAGLGRAQKCANMPKFYDCMEEKIVNRCPPSALQIFLQAILNFGCNVIATDAKGAATKVIKVDILPNLESKHESILVDSSVAAGVPLHRGSGITSSLSALNYTLSADCDDAMRTRARRCVAPLMHTWTALRTRDPRLNSVTFPLYKYERADLLELCDGYANVFLCAGFEPIQKCLGDELVRFARDHLGYMCSPQNIVRFMRHYDCVRRVGDGGDCEVLIGGESHPGRDQFKCRGVGEYYQCMTARIERECHAEAIGEFEQSIIEFGCRLPI